MSTDDKAGPSRGADADAGFEVLLYIYNISKGLAKTIKPMLLGKELPRVWHTSIVINDTEYFFCSMGVVSCPAGKTNLEEPDRIISLGYSGLSLDDLSDYLCEVGESSYTGTTYDLLNHNCNNFSQDAALFLTGNSIPPELLELPYEFLNTPLGSTFVASYEKLIKDADEVPEHYADPGTASKTA